MNEKREKYIFLLIIPFVNTTLKAFKKVIFAQQLFKKIF